MAGDTAYEAATSDQIAALAAEVRLQESFVTELRAQLDTSRAETAAAREQLARTAAERDALRDELVAGPRWREHARMLEEQLEAFRARSGVRALDRAHATAAHVPGVTRLGRRLLRTFAR